jgi:hypothetical protein
MAESKKIGRGKRQPARQAYKAGNRASVNAKKKQAAHKRFTDQDACLTRGALRAARRKEWILKVGRDGNGNPLKSFAQFEHREYEVSKYEFDKMGEEKRAIAERAKNAAKALIHKFNKK